MAGYCPSCGDKCYLICDADLIEGVTPLHQNLPVRQRRSVVYQAQVDYVHMLLGDCLPAICAALDAASLPSTDPGYIAIDEESWEYQVLMQDYVKPLILAGATQIYIESFGYNNLELDLPAQPERDEYYERLIGRIQRLQQNLQTYLAQNGAGFSTPCNCPSEDEEDITRVVGGSWGFVTGYPEKMVGGQSYCLCSERGAEGCVCNGCSCDNKSSCARCCQSN